MFQPLCKIGFAICLLLSVSGCGDDMLFEKTNDVSGQTWAWQDTLNFDFEIQDTSKVYHLLLDVAHATDYGYQNLYVQMHTRRPSGKLEKQILSLELAAPTGVWNGECSDEWCELEIPIQPKAVFSEAGTWQLAMEQYMRKEQLPGIKSMTLKIKELKN